MMLSMRKRPRSKKCGAKHIKMNKPKFSLKTQSEDCTCCGNFDDMINDLFIAGDGEIRLLYRTDDGILALGRSEGCVGETREGERHREHLFSSRRIYTRFASPSGRAKTGQLHRMRKKGTRL
jgi:hypothetical protein